MHTDRRRSVLSIAVVMLIVVSGLFAGCIDRDGPYCRYHTQCGAQTRARRLMDGGVLIPPGAVCSNIGSCVTDCLSNADCPCGSFCARSCGVCLVYDPTSNSVGVARCVAGVDPSELLSACSADFMGDAALPVLDRCDTGVAAQTNCPGFVGGTITLPDPGPASIGRDGDAVDAAMDDLVEADVKAPTDDVSNDEESNLPDVAPDGGDDATVDIDSGAEP